MDKPDVFRILTYVVSTLLTGLAISGIFHIITRENAKKFDKDQNKNEITITAPKAVSLVGGLGTVIFAVILFFFLKSDQGSIIWVGAIFIFFLLLGFSLLYYSMAFKVWVYKDKNYFIYRSFLLKKHTVCYNECEYYCCTEDFIKIKTWEKTYRIFSIGGAESYLIAELHKNGVKQKEEARRR